MKNSIIIHSVLFVIVLSIYSCHTQSVTRQSNLKSKHHKALISSSAAVPQGMELFWHDEFNNHQLDLSKWTTNYYSTADDPLWHVKLNSRPQPIMAFTDSTIVLLGDNRVSSIQTYDWGTDKNLLDNSRGGYFEVRVRRNKIDPAGKDPNTAFWLDAPGPDLKRYMETGQEAFGVKGIRPRGQVFEIDVFELLNAQFVLHGNVAPDGKFNGNLTTHIAQGYTHVDRWVTHGVLLGAGIVSHYINGDLIKTYNDKHKMYGPNHFMNVILGAYENGKMEVDYIRGYQWPLTKGNELPNPGFDINTSMFPWEGTATLTTTTKHSGKAAVILKPNQFITQYVFLNNNTNYQLKYWIQGAGNIEAKVENITPVNGVASTTFTKTSTAGKKFANNRLDFKTEPMYGTDLKMVKVIFKNTGSEPIAIDSTNITKGGEDARSK